MIDALGERPGRAADGPWSHWGGSASRDDVAEAVGYLASPGAGYITGAVLPVDGGLGMGI